MFFIHFLFSQLPIDIYFTPYQRCLPVIIKEINQAKKSIKLMCYSFTSKPIAKALIQAKKKGIGIQVIADKSQVRSKHSVIFWLKCKQIPVYIDNRVAIAHNKVMVIDDKVVITGSYNWTNAAEFKNAENLLIIRDKSIALVYLQNFRKRKEQAFIFRNLALPKTRHITRHIKQPCIQMAIEDTP